MVRNTWLPSLLRLALLPALLGTVLQAEGPNDPAPFINARGTVNGKKVLVDNTHGSTAGAADWVINGGFSDFANALADRGYYVQELRKTGPLTLTDLSGWDVLVLAECNIPFKTSEQAALLQYVQNGGSIFFIADHYNADRNKNRWDGSEVFNGYRRGAFGNPTKGMTTEEAASYPMQNVTSTDWLGTNFGVRFRYNALGDITANDIVAPSQAFGITSGVSTVAMHAGATVAILDPTKAKGLVYLPATTAKWSSAVDQGVYNGGGRAEGPFVAVAKVGYGKAAFIGDSSPVEDATPKYLKEETGGTKTTYAGWQEQNDAVLMPNVIDWLATHESYTALNQVAGLQLDTPTALLAMEDPASSTEPQAEPWATPAAGYKWYDPATFKAGSYAYGIPVASYTITASAGANGSISPTGTVTVASGGSQTFTFTPSAGYAVASVTVDGVSKGVLSSYTFSNVTANHTISVAFAVSGTSFSEGFETGTKTAYATGNVTFASGTWTLNDALLGNTSADPKVGTQSVRMRNSGKLTMATTWATGAKTVTVKHASYGSDASTTWTLWYSTNGGSTWTQTGGTVTTASTSLQTATFTLNVPGGIRFEIRKTDGSTRRVNFDDFKVVGY